jgi:hypothetical protein
MHLPTKGWVDSAQHAVVLSENSFRGYLPDARRFHFFSLERPSTPVELGGVKFPPLASLFAQLPGFARLSNCNAHKKCARIFHRAAMVTDKEEAQKTGVAQEQQMFSSSPCTSASSGLVAFDEVVGRLSCKLADGAFERGSFIAARCTWHYNVLWFCTYTIFSLSTKHRRHYNKAHI